MKRRHFLCGFLTVATLAAEPPSPVLRKVELTAKIEKVQIAMGQGMPSLLLQTQDGPVRLYLGPMRYLLEQDFRPVAGDIVQVEALRNGSDAVALRVTLTRSKVTLRLRDDSGRPVWQHHGPHHCKHHVH
jgi:hypothetical protein